MPTAQQDTEITLGTGRMLAIFFAFVLVCAFFFAIGFSLGRKTTLATIGGLPGVSAAASSTAVRPSAEKKDGTPPANSTDFSFYKAVGEKSADSGLTPPDSSSKTPSAASPTTSAPAAEASTNPAPDGASAATGYFVQVAAVSRKEDAESLVEALKKKQYPAFSANNPAIDKFYHVQVGPYGELKDAEAMRARLISDGYNPIVKK
jgi:cell division septation protein DedD